MQQVMVIEIEALPDDPAWLGRQSCPVIAYGEGATAVADVVVSDLAAAQAIEKRILAQPLAAMTLVQVLRSTECLPPAQGLDVESLAYSTLQSGPDFGRWLREREGDLTLPVEAGEPLLLSRNGALLEAVLNRPESRNSITVAMRDAWIEALQVLAADRSVEELRFRGLGACFSVGGELREFGSLPDPATAHWVRSVHSPARLLAEQSDRITCFVHGACLGSGIELPAFAARVVAHSKTFFQLPELQIGLIPGAGGTVSMTRRIGRQRVAWLVLTGRRVNAQTALAWGLVDEVTDWC